MLKAPRPGLAKTRLAAEIGEARAAAIYRALVEAQVREIPREWRVAVHFEPRDAKEEVHNWLAPLLPPHAEFVPQVPGDLGARLQAAAQHAFDQGADHVGMAGGDCPGLVRTCLVDALHRLAEADLVIIPALDGGYAFIGMKNRMDGLFEKIPWSTSEVLNVTRTRAAGLGLQTVIMPALEDVDDLASLLRAAPDLLAASSGP